MRVDLFLKTSRLIPRRSLAQKFCDSGLITVNGLIAKSSKELKAGDEVEIKSPSRYSRILVKEVPRTKQVSKSSAADLYEVLEETQIEDKLI